VGDDRSVDGPPPLFLGPTLTIPARYTALAAIHDWSLSELEERCGEMLEPIDPWQDDTRENMFDGIAYTVLRVDRLPKLDRDKHSDLITGCLNVVKQDLAQHGRAASDEMPSTSGPMETSDVMLSHRYDALISYRRLDPDKEFSRDLLKKLEADGYKVAIDERDFDPAQTFLEEMERCIKESRFTLVVMSPRYLASGNCVEEGIICKVLDMGARRRRIIPLVIEHVTMPTWLYNIVGVNFTDSDPIADPYERTKQALGTPQFPRHIGRKSAAAQSPVDATQPSARSLIAGIEFVIDRPVANFDRSHFIDALRRATGISASDAWIVSIREGSTIVRVDGKQHALAQIIATLTDSQDALHAFAKETGLTRIVWKVGESESQLVVSFSGRQAHVKQHGPSAIAESTGTVINDINQLLERARLHLLRGEAGAALDDIEVALETGIPANEETGQVELLAANHEECGYAWAIPAGLQLRAEALLLQAAHEVIAVGWAMCLVSGHG
jgi:hypothetical protein